MIPFFLFRFQFFFRDENRLYASVSQLCVEVNRQRISTETMTVGTKAM